MPPLSSFNNKSAATTSQAAKNFSKRSPAHLVEGPNRQHNMLWQAREICADFRLRASGLIAQA